MSSTFMPAMKLYLHYFGVGVVLLSLAPSTSSFSRGANQASCQEMIPGHIRAQPQDPQHSHVTLRTSASSYLPGQLVTVTVRSSRDFMGFLLQARSVEGAREAGFGAGVGGKGRTGIGPGVRSMRRGPGLVGGSWTLIPPGTHTLRCFSEGDTITHSDKQLKRNLSFVWRAPDVPMGDIRFYITVVQSYFVYWAGIESAVVRDRSRSPWSGSNITGVDGGSSIFALQEDKVTTLPALRRHRVSFKQTGNEITSHPATLRPTTTTNTGTQSYTSLEVTHSVLEMNSSTTSVSLAVDHLKNHTVDERNISVTLGSLQNATDSSETEIYVTSGSVSVVTEEAGTDTGNLVTHTEDPKSSYFSSSHLPFTVSFPSDEAKEVKAAFTLLANITVQNSSSPPSLLEFLTRLSHLKDSEVKRNEAKTNLQDLKLPTNIETRDITPNPQTNTTSIPSSNHSFHNVKPSVPTSQNPATPIQDQTSLVRFKTQSSSLQPWMTSLTTSLVSLSTYGIGSQSSPLSLNPHIKPLFQPQTASPKPFLQVQTSTFKPRHQSQTVTFKTFRFSQTLSPKTVSQLPTSSPNSILPSESPTIQAFLQSHITSSLTQAPPNKLPQNILNMTSHYQPMRENSPSTQTNQPHPQQQTPAPLTSTPLQTLSIFHQALPQAISAQTLGQASFLQTDRSHSDIPLVASSISPQAWSQSQSHPQTGAPQAHTFGWKQSQPSATPKLFNVLLSTSRFDTIITSDEGIESKDAQSIFSSVPSGTLAASSPKPTHLTTPSSLSSASTHTSSFSSITSTTPLYPSGDLTLVSMLKLLTRSSSSFTRNQPKTAPALSALPSPSPISIPPHSPPAHASFVSPTLSSFTSSAILSSSSFNHPSSAPFFPPVPISTSSPSPFESPQSQSTTFSLPSSSTIFPAISSSSSLSFASSTSSISSTTSPPSSPTSSSPTSMGSSSSFISSATSSSSIPSQSTSPHPEPSPAPRRSLYNSLTSTLLPFPSQKPDLDQRLLIQNPIASPNPKPIHNPPTPSTVVHPNPIPHPNLDPNFILNAEHEFNPKPPKTDIKSKRPNPSGTPDKEGKYPDIIPRYSAWEVGMLLGCSAGLGMVMVVGIRYMYRQTCGKRTGVTLNDRESEYGRGERGLIHVQECGDLVRVRRIRENSFVLLAEYDIVASPGD
ncbi:mucin-5AC-like [Scomber scombrus]|uniref:Mucin-5AC-like n=1 Tax=Scomber scombrus TaxID=13677 RepID=A0AAV1Q219_SCOSC